MLIRKRGLSFSNSNPKTKDCTKNHTNINETLIEFKFDSKIQRYGHIFLGQ